MNTMTVATHARQAADLLRALSNPGRLTVLCLLATGERTVGELERAVGLSQSALSQHLAVLRRKGLVKTRRFRQNVFYAIGDDRATRVIETLAGLYCPAAATASESVPQDTRDDPKL